MLATGILKQDQRLTAMEQRLNQLSSTAEETGKGREPVIARNQETLVDRQNLSMETRMTHLEEDVEDNRKHTNEQLNVVRALGDDALRRESEDIATLHQQLRNNVDNLEREINATFTRLEGEMSSLKDQVAQNTRNIATNTEWYNRLNDGLHGTIDFVYSIEYDLDGRVYILEEQMKEVLRAMRGGTTQPTSGATLPGVGETGGGGGGTRRARIMSDAEKRLKEWLNSADPSGKKSTKTASTATVTSASEETAKSEKTIAASPELRKLMYELNYNM